MLDVGSVLDGQEQDPSSWKSKVRLVATVPFMVYWAGHMSLLVKKSSESKTFFQNGMVEAPVVPAGGEESVHQTFPMYLT